MTDWRKAVVYALALIVSLAVWAVVVSLGVGWWVTR